MPKIINLKPDDDVSSVVEYLWETGASEVYFVVPNNSVLLKNIIGLKLLKREADRLDKTVFLVTKDEVGREMAKRVGLTARVAMPKVIQERKPIEEDEGTEEEVLKELSPQEYESLIEQEVKLKRETAGRVPKMSDIRPKPQLSQIKMEEEEESKAEEEYLEIKPEEEPKPFFPKKFLEENRDELDLYLKQTEKIKEVYPAEEDFERREIDFSEGPIKQRKPAPTFFSFKFFGFFIGGAFLVAAAVLYFVLPKAEIVIVPKTEDIVQDLKITADKSVTKIDDAQARIPAQLIKLDKKETKQFPASGQRQLNDKARGTISIYNEYSSSPQGLVEKTRFVSDDGKVFRITKSITVPGAKIEEGKIIPSSIDAQVQADQPGEDYNIGPSNFHIPGFQGGPKYEAFYGRSKNPMTGGAVGVARVVSQEDFDKAKKELWQSLQPLIEQEIKAQVPSGFKLLDGAIKEEMIGTESNVGIGDRADNFTLIVKGTATVLFFDEKDIFEIVAKKNAERAAGDKTLDEEERQIVYRDATVDFNKGLFNFKAKVIQKLVWKVDVDGLTRLVAGKDEVQIKEIFSQRQEIDKARILFWPFWVKSVPNNLDKIKIKISSK